jgi:hypothetical protein
MQVICFYWEGERWQEKQELKGEFVHHLKRIGTVSRPLVEKYVNNLYYGVNRFAEEDFKFICFTNVELNIDSNVELRYLPMFSEKGVLPRLYMFSRDAGLFGDQVLCLDLDLVITGSLKDIMKYKGKFCTRTSFKDKSKLDGDIMSFRAGKETEDIFWNPFINDVKAAEQITRGRERYWMRHVANDIADKWYKIVPGQIISYKHSVRNTKRTKPPKNTRIVSCHGEPRPHQIKDEWIKEYWK